MKTLSSRKKIIISIIALAVALVVATGSTYAWFTMGNTVTLDDFQVGVTTETDNLYVAAGTINTADNELISDKSRGDRKAISTTAAGLYDIDTNTYKITLSQDTINDVLIHQYGAMVRGTDINNKPVNYALIPVAASTALAIYVPGRGTVPAETAPTYYADATGTALTTQPTAGADATKFFVKKEATIPAAATAEYFYYYNENTDAIVVLHRTNAAGNAVATGTSNDKWTYKVDGAGDSVKVYPNTAMDALTTADGKNFTTIAGNTVNAIDAAATEEIDKMANFTEFTVYFRSTAEAYDISLGNSATVTAIETLATKITAWATAAANAYGSDGVYDDEMTAGVTDIAARAANAVRISFTNEAGETFIWNPNAATGYNKGNLADDYWAYINGGTAASTTYSASYAQYLAREAGLQSYALTKDATAKAGKTYYSDAYENVTVAENAYTAGKYYTLTGTAVPAPTAKFFKNGDNYNPAPAAALAGTTYVTLTPATVTSETLAVAGTDYYKLNDTIYEKQTIQEGVAVGEDIVTLVESAPVTYAAGTYYTLAGEVYTAKTVAAGESLADCYTCVAALSTDAYSGTAKYYSRKTATFAVGTVYEEIVNVKKDSSANTFDGTTLTTLKYVQADAAYEANLTVRVWLEGWDGDCFDDILSDFFQTTLAFSGRVA